MEGFLSRLPFWNFCCSSTPTKSSSLVDEGEDEYELRYIDDTEKEQNEGERDLDELSKTMNKADTSAEGKIRKRQVSFERVAKVRRIPREERDEARTRQLWWSEDDLIRFKNFSQEVFNEHGTLSTLTTYDYFNGLDTSYISSASVANYKQKMGANDNNSPGREGVWLTLRQV
mmetsp:Transcript_44224/g.76393  ORF Transcript_44224/g.76393 Transcript_44224/m.76393 type:complete len:173 (-) Transcript_44224:389-907(-)